MSETSPLPSEAVIQTAARLLAAGRAAEAADRLHQLVDEAPTYAAAHVLLASALDASGRTSEALDVWRRAAFLVPQSPLVHRERQRLVEAHRDAPSQMPEEPEEVPIETWDETIPNPTDITSEDSAQAPENELAPETASPPIELATETDVPSDPASAPQETAPVEPEGPRASEPREDEPIEMPLLPPEGDVRSMPHPPPPEVEMEDDGWAIIEDDMVPPATETPISAPLLSPEPEADPTPPARPAPQPDASPVPEPTTPDSSIADDLDDLITQLDAAPRIKPDPTFSGPKVSFDESSMDDMVSETLAKIYAAQHQYVEAAVVYEKLAVREPDHADTHLERAAEMRDKAS